MFRKFKFAAIISAAALMAAMPMSVYADEAGCDDFDYADDELIVEEIVYDDPDYTDDRIVYYVTAEDGATGPIWFYPDDSENYFCEIGTPNPADEYDFPEYKGGTGTYYSDPSQIPMIEDQVLMEAEYTVYRDDGSWFSGKKFYIIDYKNITLTYVGHNIETEYVPDNTLSDTNAPAGTADGGVPASDGVTVPANTGNSSISAIVAAIALGAIFFSKKVK